MFVRNMWHIAGWDYHLARGATLARTIINEPIVLFRRMDGSVAALEDRCCHRAAALHLGKIEDDCVRCMYHGMKFNGSGECVHIPGQDKIPIAAKVRAYPATERDNWIWVWMGDPQLADPNLIPKGIGPSHPEWNMTTGEITFNADYRLIMDNLLDFSHLTYVHRNSFGGTDEYAETKPVIETTENSVHIERWVKNVAPPVFAWDAFGGPEMRLDMHYDYTLHLPCTFLMRFKLYAAGTQESGPSNGQLLLDTWTSQGITAVNEEESHYYFSWGANSETDSPGIAPLLRKGVLQAFNEDKEMIEAQHFNLKHDQNRDLVAIGHDQGLMHMRRALYTAIENEA